ncbi:MAG: hypothetical protein J6L82_10185, partial [Alphaproteobacteria bacterium]|nr:hypothetical protein [Alphaproteobacteria bacterium]
TLRREFGDRKGATPQAAPQGVSGANNLSGRGNVSPKKKTAPIFHTMSIFTNFLFDSTISFFIERIGYENLGYDHIVFCFCLRSGAGGNVR